MDKKNIESDDFKEINASNFADFLKSKKIGFNEEKILKIWEILSKELGDSITKVIFNFFFTVKFFF